MDDPKSSRKRKRIVDLSVDLTGTKFGQLRRVLLELRPYVLEVLRSPDFQNSRGAPIVIQGTRQIKELCKQLRDETMSLAKQKRISDSSTGPAIKEDPGTKNHVDVDLDRLISVDDPGPPLIGCSPTGWNFIVVRNLPGKAA